MTIERKGLIKFNGKDVTVVGPDVVVGQKAPEFTAHGPDWAIVHALESTHGKIRIIGSLLSLNTSVCDRETRRFNQEATSLSNDVAILVVSMDLPYTTKNWCAAAGVERVLTLSDHMEAEFGMKYGVLIKELRILRRAIFVVDRKDQVVYADYMPALGDEPNYGEVLETVKKILA
jgi:thiol peroxidase